MIKKTSLLKQFVSITFGKITYFDSTYDFNVIEK